MNRFILYVWDHFPSSRKFIKKIFFDIANIILKIGERLGLIYSDLFSRLGTSWFDHRFDYLKGISNYHWMERAFFSLDIIKKGDVVLNIGCGDGSFDGLYYADKAEYVVSIDKDPVAISHAKKYYKRPNVSFVKLDITRKKLPSKKYNIVLMFAVIEHFTELEGIEVLKNIKQSLKSGGILFGSTPLLKSLGKSNWEHKNEFCSTNQLKTLLSKVFQKIDIKIQKWSEGRTEIYFKCSV